MSIGFPYVFDSNIMMLKEQFNLIEYVFHITGIFCEDGSYFSISNNQCDCKYDKDRVPQLIVVEIEIY